MAKFNNEEMMTNILFIKMQEKNAMKLISKEKNKLIYYQILK